MISLQRLEGFYWVARTGGYARAARSFPFPISQPGVHQQVRRLEEEMKTKLFERVGKDKVALTPAGESLWKVVAPFYEQLPALEARIREGKIAGTLRIAAAGQVLRHLLPEWLRRLQTKSPSVKVSLTEVSHADPKMLLDGSADLLVDWLETIPAGVEARVVGKARAFVVAPAFGPHGVDGKVSLQKLAEAPFIAYGADRTLNALQHQALRQHGMMQSEAFTADSSDTILGFVSAGLGYSLVPWLTEAGPRVSGVHAWPLTQPKAEFEIHAAWRQREIPHPLVEAALAVAP